jgi:hypothetical protein
MKRVLASLALAAVVGLTALPINGQAQPVTNQSSLSGTGSTWGCIFFGVATGVGIITFDPIMALGGMAGSASTCDF